MKRNQSIVLPVGATLRRLREQRKLTCQDVATTAGLSRAYVTRLEADANAPTLNALHCIAQALGVSASELVREAEGAL